MKIHLFFSVVFALQLFPAFAAEVKSTDDKFAKEAVKDSVLNNLGKVDENLYRGAHPDKAGFKELKKLGIKTIVNLRYAHSDQKDFDGIDFKYFQIPMNPAKIKDEDVATFLKIMSDKDNFPVFVHCHAGADRTGVMIASYRMYFFGWTPQQALEELPKHGFHKEWINIPEYIKNFDKEKMKKLIQEQK